MRENVGSFTLGLCVCVREGVSGPSVVLNDLSGSLWHKIRSPAGQICALRANSFGGQAKITIAMAMVPLIRRVRLHAGEVAVISTNLSVKRNAGAASAVKLFWMHFFPFRVAACLVFPMLHKMCARYNENNYAVFNVHSAAVCLQHSCVFNVCDAVFLILVWVLNLLRVL